MRKVQKIAVGICAAGVLAAGIGTGVALAEFGSLEYSEHTVIGLEHLTTETLDYDISGVAETQIALLTYYGLSLETDNSLPENIVRYEITYNPDKVEPYLYYATAHEGKRGELDFICRLKGSDVAAQEFFDMLEQVKTDLKEGKIGSYESRHVSEVIVKVNEALLPRIENAGLLMDREGTGGY